MISSTGFWRIFCITGWLQPNYLHKEELQVYLKLWCMSTYIYPQTEASVNVCLHHHSLVGGFALRWYLTYEWFIRCMGTSGWSFIYHSLVSFSHMLLVCTGNMASSQTCGWSRWSCTEAFYLCDFCQLFNLHHTHPLKMRLCSWKTGYIYITN